MDTFTGASRRTLLTGSALTAALALASQPTHAKRKKKGQKKPKPPIATCIAQFQSATLGPSPGTPVLATTWHVSGWDLRTSLAVGFSLGTVSSVISMGAPYQEDIADRIDNSLRRAVASSALGLSANQIKGIRIIRL